jgi:CO dehydrogenase/acetyl-CoA synthase delta subunit
MNRLQLSPIFGTRQSQMHLPLGERLDVPIANFEPTTISRSWLIYDSAPKARREDYRPNWNIVTGLTLAIAVSIGCWVGIAFALATIWK